MPRVLRSYAERWRLVSYNLHFHCDSQFKPSLDLVTYREDGNGKSRMVLMKNFWGFFYCYVEVPDYVEDLEIMCFFLCWGFGSSRRISSKMITVHHTLGNRFWPMWLDRDDLPICEFGRSSHGFLPVKLRESQDFPQTSGTEIWTS